MTNNVSMRRRTGPLSLSAAEARTIILALGIAPIISAKGAAWSRSWASIFFGVALAWIVFSTMRRGQPAHANPDVSLGAFVARDPDNNLVRRSVIAIAAFTVGNLILAFLPYLYGWQQSAATRYGAAVPAPGMPDHAQFWWAVLTEAIFVLVVLAVSAFVNNAGAAAVLMGLNLGLCVYWSWNTTGGGVNLARELPGMLLTGLFTGQWYVISPLGELLGAVLAGLLFLPVQLVRNNRQRQTAAPAASAASV